MNKSISIYYKSIDLKARAYLSILFFLTHCSIFYQSAAETKYLGITFDRNVSNRSVRIFDSKGLSIFYASNFGGNLSIQAKVSAGFSGNPLKSKYGLNDSRLLASSGASLLFHPLQPNAAIIPSVIAGLSLSKYSNYYGAHIPVGIGLRVNLWRDAFIHLSSEYNQRIVGSIQSYYSHSIGVAGLVKTKHKAKPNRSVPLPIATNDLKITHPGILDTDSDGIVDSVDHCPTVPGFAKYKGCPVPDTDQDGINDEEDSCRLIVGMSRYHGCPVPDRDSDGVSDEVDKCIDTPGVAENQGCPIVKPVLAKAIDSIARNIFFETSSYTLKEESFKPLDELAQILQTSAEIKIVIEGHTDNQGTRKNNQVLSDNRANEIKIYLMKKGIDPSRLTATGYGQEKPVDNNTTPEGRSRNRRVELKIK